MEKRTLRDYVMEATNYLYPVSDVEEQISEREKFINFCESNGLADEFIRLIANDSKWSELAKTETIQYFVEIPKDEHYRSRNELPQIKLLACELGTVPVIKVVSKQRFL